MADMDPLMKSILHSFQSSTNPMTGTKISPKTSLTRVKRKPKPITQRLRSIETQYSLSKPDLDTLFQARQLITDLWELHWDADPDLKEEARRLFEQAGLEMNK